MLFLPETEGEFDFREYQYVVDAVDNVTAKLLIIRRAREAGVPVISAMGAETSCTPKAFGSRTSKKHPCVLWQESCAGN